MKQARYLAIFSTLILMFPVGLFAKAKYQRSVDIPNPVQIAGQTLKPGSYKVEWQEAGPQVHVTFVKNGKEVAAAPATLKTNDTQVDQNDIQTASSSNGRMLTEIDFAHQKEALIFGRS